MTNHLTHEASGAPVTEAVRSILKLHSEVDILIKSTLEVSEIQSQASVRPGPSPASPLSPASCIMPISASAKP